MPPVVPRYGPECSTRAGCGEKSSRSFPAVRKVTRVHREVGAPSHAPTGVPARAELDPSLLCGPKGLRGKGPGAGVAEEPARRARGSAGHAGAGAGGDPGPARRPASPRGSSLVWRGARAWIGCLPCTGGPGTQPEPERAARPSATRGGACTPQGPRRKAPGRCGGQQPKGMPPAQPCHPYLLLLLLLACWPQGPSAQVMDFLFEKWKLYSDQCHHNLSLLPAPTELVCNRTFDKYSCWPDTPPNTTANISCPWYLPWYHKVQHRLVFKECGPDGQWVRGPRGQPWRNASQCQMDDQEIEVQKEVAKMYSRFQMMYTVGYSLSLGALLLALAILLALSKLHCTRNYIHLNLFASFVLKAGSVLVIDWLLKIRYSQKIGDDLSVSVWLSDGAVAGCRMAAVIMQYGVVANYCWLLVEGMYLHSLLSLATFPERSFFTLYLGIGWGAPLLFVIPWVVVKCLFENIQCWTSNNNMGFWWILRVPVFLAILINFCIFVRIVHLLVAKLRARQMHYADYKFRLARSTLTLIPLLGVHEVVFAFVTDEQAQGTLRSAKLFFDLFLSSFQGLLVAVLYCFLNKEVQAELWRRWWRWREGKALLDERITGSHSAPTRPSHSPLCEKLQLVKEGSSKGASQDPCAETPLANGLPGLAKSPL